MKVLVAVKRVVDYQVAIRIKSDGSGVETSNVKMSMNPFDEIAVEEAVRLKEKNIATEVVVVSIGPSANQEIIRSALAMGADRGILVESQESLEPLAIAKILQKINVEEQAQLILLGKQAIDSDDNQVGQMVAGLLNWPQATFASKLEFHDEGVSVTREIDGGLETLFIKLPGVITTDLRLNEPRYLSLPNIVKAKQKKIDTLSANTLGCDVKPRFEVVTVSLPEKKRSGVEVENVEKLIDCLKHEAQVL